MNRSAGRLERALSTGQVENECVTVFFKMQPRRRRGIYFNIVGPFTLPVAVLQRGHSHAMKRDVHIRRIRVKSLTKNQNSFAVRIAA